jgi:hypothetical protein
MPFLTRAGNKNKRFNVIAEFAGVTKKRPISRKSNPSTSTSSIDFDEDVEFSKDLNNKNNNFI